MMTSAIAAAPVLKGPQVAAPTVSTGLSPAPPSSGRPATVNAVDPPPAANAVRAVPTGEDRDRKPTSDSAPTGPRPAFSETFLQRAVRTALNPPEASNTSSPVSEPVTLGVFPSSRPLVVDRIA